MTSSDGNNQGHDGGHEPIDGFDNDPFADLTELLEHNFAPAEPGPAVSIASREMPTESLSDDERLDRVLAELASSPVADGSDPDAAEADGSGAKGSVVSDPGTLDFEAEFAQALDAELDSDSYRPVVIARALAPHPIELEAASAVAAPALANGAYAAWIAPRGAGRKPVVPSPDRNAEPAMPDSKVAAAAKRSQAADETFDARLDSELELALSGLSAPANPRQIPFHRSEAFAPDRAEATQKQHSEDKPYDDFDELIASELAAMRPLANSQTATHASPHVVAAYDAASHAHRETTVSEDSADWTAGDAARAASSARVDPAFVAGSASRTANRGWGLGASLLAIALVGGLGTYVLVGDDLIGAPSDVLLVKADSTPIKVAPQDPGGRSIPNQNKAVYERVQSAAADEQPSQKRLLTAVEEPVDLPKAEDNGLPGVDLSPITGARAAELARTDAALVPGVSAVAEPDPHVLQPRRVRTLTVRPDGTLVVENAAPSDGAFASNGAPAMLETAAKPIEMPTAVASIAKPASVEPAATKSIAPAPEPVRTASIEAPKPAAAEPTANSPYYVQISSQPNEEAAKQSQSNLTRRYASVIGGRDVVIQTADIAGKGTYYRVRVGANSRDEASSLCASLKSAGGSCFVSR